MFGCSILWSPEEKGYPFVGEGDIKTSHQVFLIFEAFYGMLTCGLVLVLNIFFIIYCPGKMLINNEKLLMHIVNTLIGLYDTP